jgi:hypothetical protein
MELQSQHDINGVITYIAIAVAPAALAGVVVRGWVEGEALGLRARARIAGAVAAVVA